MWRYAVDGCRRRPLTTRMDLEVHVSLKSQAQIWRSRFGMRHLGGHHAN